MHTETGIEFENLDCLVDPADLRAWGFEVMGHKWSGKSPRTIAAAIFPERPRGYVSAATSLAHYASNKATAMECRTRGDIDTARMYETICERIYSSLPEYAKW
jgi:hypothetical protein